MGTLRWLVAGAGVAVGGLALLAVTESPAERRRVEAAPAAPVVTAVVEQRVLSDVLTLTGRVAAAEAHQVVASASAAVEGAGGEVPLAVVTTEGQPVGAQLGNGTLLVAVSGRPIFLLQGDLPQYRSIGPGMNGDDVVVLQEALRQAGYAVRDTSGTYGRSTQAAVGRLWEDNGFEPDVDPAASAQLDQAREALAAVPEDQPEARAAAAQAVDDLAEAAGPRVPLGAVVVLPASPVTVVSSDAPRGRQVEPGTPILELTAAPPVLDLVATPAQAALLRTGLRATTIISGAPATGAVQWIAPPASGSDSSNGEGVPVTVAPDQPLGYDLVGSNVTVEVELSTSGDEVLAVPASALRSGPDGTDVVVRLRPDDGAAPVRERIEVEIGAVVAGFVEVIAATPALAPDDVVLVGE